MSEFNFSPKLFRGSIENNIFQDFLKDQGFIQYFLDNISTFGVIKAQSDPNFQNFKVQSGTNAGTIKIPIQSTAIDNQGRKIVKDSEDNIALPAADTWYWIKISWMESTLEQGTVSISSNGTITGNGTEFTKKLRGGKYTPSKIKFESGNNSLEYQVVEVIDDTNALISGSSFVAESNIRYSVIGTFAPDAVPTADEKYPFRYDGVNFELIEEQTLNTAPAKIDGEEFFIARVQKDVSDNVFIEDKRSEFLRTKADAKLEINSEGDNPLIGIEAIKWTSNETTRDHNIVEIAWGFRSSNFTVDSSLNKITLSGGQGGVFKNTDDFTDGDFDGWRLYWSDGTYSKVNSSTLISSQINVVLDNLDPDKLNTTTEVLLVPNVESIVIDLETTNTDALGKLELEFPINQRLAKLLVQLYDIDNSDYNLSYRYKKHNVYSQSYDFNSDATGYLDETSFNADGTLKALEDRNRVTVTDGNFTLLAASNTYFNRINSVDRGDLLGVNTFSLNNSDPILEFQVGSNKQIQKIDGTITLTTDHYLSLETNGAIEGNSFTFIFTNDITLDGNVLAITQEYVNTGDVGTVKFTFDNFYVTQALNGNLSINFIFDGTNWIINEINTGLTNQVIERTRIADNSINSDKIDASGVEEPNLATDSVNERVLETESFLTSGIRTGWNGSAFTNGSKTYEGFGYRKTADKTVQLKGWIYCEGATILSIPFLQLPAGYRPSNTRFFPVLNFGSGLETCQIDPDGLCYIEGFDAANAGAPGSQNAYFIELNMPI